MSGIGSAVFLGIDLGWYGKPSGVASITIEPEGLTLRNLTRLQEADDILTWIQTEAGNGIPLFSDTGGFCCCLSCCRCLLWNRWRLHEGVHAWSQFESGSNVQSTWCRTFSIAPYVVAPSKHSSTPIVVLSVIALALLCTAVAYLLYFWLIQHAGPTRALTVTFLAPVFGVLWGTVLLSEPLSLSTFIGFGIILVGTGFVTGVRLRKKPIIPPVEQTQHDDTETVLTS